MTMSCVMFCLSFAGSHLLLFAHGSAALLSHPIDHVGGDTGDELSTITMQHASHPQSEKQQQ